MEIADQIGDVASLVGLLLALDTLFTTEQSRRLDEEAARQGGPRSSVVRAVMWSTMGLALLTTCADALLAPLMMDVLRTIGTSKWEPVLGVFGLTYVLLLALLWWQVGLFLRARKQGD
jgi:hypothetical protein